MQTENFTLKSIFEEIVKNRNELKNFIEASETRVLFKIETINQKVLKLEKENQLLRDKVEAAERQLKRKNIIVFGIEKPSQDISAKYICDEINSHLEINITPEDISDIHLLGKTENRPVKVELLSYIKKKLIIENCYKLKGKAISVSHDLTQNQRDEVKILRKHLHCARENPRDKSYIRGNKLYINNKFYTAKDLAHLEEIEESEIRTKNSSAPSTPTPYAKSTTDSNIFHSVLMQERKQCSPLKKIENKTETTQNNSETERQTSSYATPKNVQQKPQHKIGNTSKDKPNTRSTSSQRK